MIRIRKMMMKDFSNFFSFSFNHTPKKNPLSSMVNNVAKKSDLSELKTELKSDMEQLQTGINVRTCIIRPSSNHLITFHLHIEYHVILIINYISTLFLFLGDERITKETR